MATKEELLKLAQDEGNAITDASIAAEEEAAQRQIDNQLEMDKLAQTQQTEMQGLTDYNKAQYQNQGQILQDIQSKIGKAKEKDATALKRENAYRYISGLGDTLSGLANLVGVAHGASNQQQTYNSNIVAQKAEAARKARKLEMEDLSKRQDEMAARLREMKAAGSLKEAELAVRQGKEKAALLDKQKKEALEAKRYADTKEHQASREARQDFVADRAYNAQQAAAKQAQENWQKTYNMQYSKFKQEEGKQNYNFTLANETIDIPKEKLNDVNVERIYQMLPDEIKNAIKGEQYTELVPGDDPMMEPTKRTSYKAPSLAQKLAAIGAYADADENIKNELRRLADPNYKSSEDEGTTPQNATVGAKTGTDWGAYATGSASAKLNSPQPVDSWAEGINRNGKRHS